MAQTDKKVVLYIAGWGRTGSTLLGSILGQLPGFCYVGEPANIWTSYVAENPAERLVGDAPCGCGVRLRECPMWTAVFERAFGGIEPRHAMRMFELRQRWPNNKMLLLRRALGLQIRQGRSPEAIEYAEGLRLLYDAICEHTQARVIVDSSKIPSYALAVASLPNVDLRLLHLVRDPRATAYSWLRQVRVQGKRMKRLPVWRSSAQWTSWNATTGVVAKELALPTVRLCYEDFVRQPQQAVMAALELVRDVAPIEIEDLPFVSPREIDLRPTHNVWGNLRYRQTVGRVSIVPDDEWDAQLAPLDRAVVAGLTYPLARRYGYYRK